MADLSR
jgi:hypothetical protein